MDVTECRFALSPSNLQNQPVEVGTVQWGRDYSAALSQSRETGKPIFLLFQEVPGCSGCRQFGTEVLSHPLVKAAVEESFEPLLIHNNKGGEDERVRERFNEPAWNYQVVRFLDAEGQDIIPRRDRVWQIQGITRRMILVLEKTRRLVPDYLRLLADETDQSRHGQVVFSTHCFWTGELRLGAIEGVIGTEAGWYEGREVTIVTYHRDRVSLFQLVGQARELEITQGIYLADAAERNSLVGIEPGLEIKTLTDSYRPASESDQKRQLQGTVFAKLDLTPAQATKVNAFARTQPEQAATFLTEEQRKIIR